VNLVEIRCKNKICRNILWAWTAEEQIPADAVEIRVPTCRKHADRPRLPRLGIGAWARSRQDRGRGLDFPIWHVVRADDVRQAMKTARRRQRPLIWEI